MRYFTKEFYVTELLSFTDKAVRKSKQAEIKDEEFYKYLYNKRCMEYIRIDKMNDFYLDPIKELNKINEYVNEPDIDNKERERRTLRKNLYVSLNRKNIEYGTCFKFDREFSKRKFEVLQNSKIKLYSYLPKKIIEKIADIRVFALGYASEEVKQFLSPYCIKLRKQIEQIKYNAVTETCDAEDYLTDEICFDNLEGNVIFDIAELIGNVYMKLENDKYLIFKNAIITEGKEKKINRYEKDKPNPECTRILATELHWLGCAFEVCFLVVNSDRYENEELWYLSIHCTDIKANFRP